MHIKFTSDGPAKVKASTPRNTELLRLEQEIDDKFSLVRKKLTMMEKEGLDLTPEARLLEQRLKAAKENGSPDSVTNAIFEEAERLVKAVQMVLCRHLVAYYIVYSHAADRYGQISFTD